MSLLAVSAEARRAFRLANSYRIRYAADLVLYLVGFLLLMTVYFAASQNFGPEIYLSTLIGYLTWWVCANVMAAIADIAGEETRTGTLEQLFLTGRSPAALFLGRTLGLTLNYSLRGLLMGALLVIVPGYFRPIPAETLLVFILSLIGAVGLGFALAGLVLVYKRAGGAITLVWQMLVFFTGALAPLQSSAVLDFISKLLPLTWGISAMRALAIEGLSMAALWQNGQLLGLIVNTAVYAVLGGSAFYWGHRKARALGVLGHY